MRGTDVSRKVARGVHLGGEAHHGDPDLLRLIELVVLGGEHGVDKAPGGALDRIDAVARHRARRVDDQHDVCGRRGRGRLGVTGDVEAQRVGAVAIIRDHLGVHGRGQSAPGSLFCQRDRRRQGGHGDQRECRDGSGDARDHAAPLTRCGGVQSTHSHIGSFPSTNSWSPAEPSGSFVGSAPTEGELPCGYLEDSNVESERKPNLPVEI